MDLHQLVEKTVTGLGYELVDLELTPRARVIRVFIDQLVKAGGIDVDDCVAVSNQLSRVLMVEEVDYDRLEVSSPGLDRPLKKLADFDRFAGQEVHVRLRVALNNRRNFNGILMGVRDGKVCVRLIDKNSGKEEAEVALEPGNIDKARLEPKFD